MRRLIAIPILLVIVLSAFASFGVVRAVSNASPVVLVVGFELQSQTLAPGTTSPANMTLAEKNNAQVYATSVTLNTASPLSLVGTGSTFFVGNMNPLANKTFTIILSASPNAKLGSYSIQYNITYYDTFSTFYSDTGRVYVTVSGTPAKPQLGVSSVTFSATTITPGSSFATRINVTNTGNEGAYVTSLTLDPQHDLSVAGGTGLFALGTLDSRQSKVITVTMSVSPTAPSESVPVLFALSYTDRFGLTYGANGTYSVTVAATPDVKVGTFALSVAPLRPGVSAFLTLTMLNVGADRVYDVKLSLSGSPILASAQTNYLGAVQSGGLATASFYLSVPNDTAPGNYMITLRVTYSDIAGKIYSSSNNYSIPIESSIPPSVTLTGTIMDPPILSNGAQGTLTLFVKNTGNTEARNVTITIEGGTGILTSSYFGVGTMEPGDSVTQVVGVNVGPSLQAGARTLLFLVSYTDSAGKSFQTSVPLETSIYQASNIFTIFNIAIVAGVVYLFAIALFVLRRARMI